MAKKMKREYLGGTPPPGEPWHVTEAIEKLCRLNRQWRERITLNINENNRNYDKDGKTKGLAHP